MLEWEYASSEHRLLATQISRMESTGISCRDAFLLSQGMGRVLSAHKLYGLDAVIWDEDQGGKTLRDLCLHDYVNLIRPSIETLRTLFEESDNCKIDRL